MIYDKPKPGARLARYLALRNMQNQSNSAPADIVGGAPPHQFALNTAQQGRSRGNYLSSDQRRILQTGSFGYHGNHNLSANSAGPGMRFGQAGYDPIGEERIRETRIVNKDGSVTVTRQTTTTGVVDGRQVGVGRVKYRPQRTAAGAPATISDDLESRLLTLSEMEGGSVIEVTSGKRSPEQQRRVSKRQQSQHIVGDAADIKIVGKTPSEAADAAWSSGLFNTVAEYLPQAGGHTHIDQVKRGGKSRRYKTDRAGSWANRVDERD